MYDSEFLKRLDEYQHKEKYAKITALTLNEQPVEVIEGKVAASGTINIDGASAVRRTCSLSLLAYDTKVTDFYWGLQNKFKLEIGLKNEIDSNYPDIIWFNQGIYAITSFSSSVSNGNYNISISGKDKMCYLNGDLGGIFPSSVDLGAENVITKNGEESISKTVKMTIPYIIKEMVHNYGNEPYYNIIINDLEDSGLELMEYRGENRCYLISDNNDETKTVMSLNGDQGCWYYDYDDEGRKVKVNTTFSGAIENKKSSIYDKETNTLFKITSYNYGETIGYRLTDLVFTSDLIASVGDTVTSILDKIVNMLGEFEYFYDLEGRFIFQKKKTYVQTAWTPIQEEKNGTTSFWVDPAATASPYSYVFSNNYLVTSISNSPKLDNIKNDFSIWGTRQSVSGADLDIHLRYAIHNKPVEYTSVEITGEDIEDFKTVYPEFKNITEQTSSTYKVSNVGDWREIIYRMAQDQLKYGHFDNFEDKIIQANGDLYPNGRTGYEQYYADMIGFWRDLYHGPDTECTCEDKGKYHWVTGSLETLNFWIDFLDPAGELEKYSVTAIGSRPKAATDKDVKAISYRETPNLIYYYPDEKNKALQEKKTGYTYVQLQPSMTNLLKISSQGKSAKDTLDEWLNQYLYGAESISLSCVPIYYLEPNTRIKVLNEDVSLSGEYIIDNITLPLTYNGTMSISASKTIESIY